MLANAPISRALSASHPLRSIPGFGDIFLVRAGDSRSSELLAHDLSGTTALCRLVAIIGPGEDLAHIGVEDIMKRIVIAFDKLEEGYQVRPFLFGRIDRAHQINVHAALPDGRTSAFRLASDAANHEFPPGTDLKFTDSEHGEVTLRLPHALTLRGCGSFGGEIDFQGTKYKYVHGDAAVVGELIEKYGLTPSKAVKVRGGQIGFSPLFPLDEERVASIGWVSTPKDQHLRLFYRSNSQAVFRLLPSIKYEEITLNGGGAYDKGPGEGPITLGARFQAALAELLREGVNAEGITPTLGQFIAEQFVIVHRYPGEFALWKQSRSNLNHAVSLKPFLKRVPRTHQLKTDHSSRPHPDAVRIDGRGRRPDFLRGPVLTFALESRLSGRVQALVYRSYDRTLEYTVLIDAEKVAWFGQVEFVKSPLTSFGVRAKAIDASSLLTPRWEYGICVPKAFHGNTHPQFDSYVDGKRYVSRIPELKRFGELVRKGKIRLPDMPE